MFRTEQTDHFRMFSMREDRTWIEAHSGVEEWVPPRPTKRFADEPCTDSDAFDRVAFIHDGMLCGATRRVRRSDDYLMCQPPDAPTYCYQDTGLRTSEGLKGLPAGLRSMRLIRCCLERATDDARDHRAG